MYKNHADDGSNSYCRNYLIKAIEDRGMSQNDLAIELQKIGLDIDKNAISRIINGKRFVTDVEIRYMSRFLVFLLIQ